MMTHFTSNFAAEPAACDNLQSILIKRPQSPRRLILTLSCLSFAAVGALVMLAGCNSNPSLEGSNSPPKLSMAADQESGDSGTSSNLSAPTVIKFEDPSAKNSTNGDDDEAQFEALIKELRQTFREADAGKQVDFGPVAAKVCARVETHINGDNLDLASQVAHEFVAHGANDAARLVFNSLHKIAENIAPGMFQQFAQEISTAGLRQLDSLGTKPEISGQLVGGGKFDWNQYRGKVVLLDFWATWCPNCIAEMPELQKIYTKYRDQGVEVVGLSLDNNRKDVTDFLEHKTLPWPILFDGEPTLGQWDNPYAKQFGVMAIPVTMLVDRTGKIISIYTPVDELPQMLDKLLAQH